MTLLGIDTSAQAASAAVCTEDQVIASGFINIRLTHSQTILPLVRDMLAAAQLSLADIDAFAVSSGPGSFTGLRIAVSAIKGMAQALDKPCIGVPTLEALAYNLLGYPGVLCAVMDARRNQVYNALFRSSGAGITRLCEDRAITVEALAEELALRDEPVILVGDGAELCARQIDGVTLAPPHLRHQLAASVCMAAFGKPAVTAAQLMPGYLRLPQAERERMAKERAENNL